LALSAIFLISQLFNACLQEPKNLTSSDVSKVMNNHFHIQIRNLYPSHDFQIVMQRELPYSVSREASQLWTSNGIDFGPVKLLSSDVLQAGLHPKDILLGRNTTNWHYEGNQYFQFVIDLMLKEYQEATNKIWRNHVVSKVIALIRESGGRFKKRNPETNQWEELSYEKARTKVSHALRDGLDRKTGKRKYRRAVRAENQTHPFPTHSPSQMSAVLSNIFSKEEFTSEDSSMGSSTSSLVSSTEDIKNDEDSSDDSFSQLINAVLGPLADPSENFGGEDTWRTPFDFAMAADSMEPSFI
jgi:hypothetical protein